MKIKIGGDKKYQQELFVPVHTTLASTFTDYILNWLCFADLPANIPTNIQNVRTLKDIDQKNLTLIKKDSLSAGFIFS